MLTGLRGYKTWIWFTVQMFQHYYYPIPVWKRMLVRSFVNRIYMIYLTLPDGMYTVTFPSGSVAGDSSCVDIPTVEDMVGTQYLILFCEKASQNTLHLPWNHNTIQSSSHLLNTYWKYFLLERNHIEYLELLQLLCFTTAEVIFHIIVLSLL